MIENLVLPIKHVAKRMPGILGGSFLYSCGGMQQNNEW
jgi:hypothetical protein